MQKVIPKAEEQIIQSWKNYLDYTKSFFQDTHYDMYDMGESKDNHSRHDKDTEYIKNMILPISDHSDVWAGKKALDFGCGCGRNIRNLIQAAEFSRVDGCDVSLLNANYSKKYIENLFNLDEGQTKCRTWETNGYNLQPCEDNEYDYVMSHIVFQHIANYSIRFNIIKDIYRVLNKGGIANLHFMDLGGSVSYYEEYPSPGSIGEQGLLNCRVEDSSYLIKDFSEIGFRKIECFVGIDPYANKKSYYIRGIK